MFLFTVLAETEMTTETTTSGSTNMTNGCDKIYCGLPYLCDPLFIIMGISAILFLSLCLNIYFCASRCRSGRWTCNPRKRHRRGPRQMEENPIYGNLGFVQTSTTLFPDTDPQQRVNSDTQSKTQDCYANLTLKPPRLHSGCSSPQIQFSDEILSEEQLEMEKEDEPCTDAISTMSDLYASVQTQRTKMVHAADSGEEYANHL